MKREKRIVYRANKKGELYRYDLKMGERRLATEGERKRYLKDIIAEIEREEANEKRIDEIKKTAKRHLMYAAFLVLFLCNGKNGYTNADRLCVELECLLNSEEENKIIWKKINDFLQNNIIYNKQEYTVAYQYLIENCSSNLSPDNLIGIFDVISKNIFENQKTHPLIADCIKSIVAGSNGNYEGNIRLSIISDILGEDTVTYLLLTNQEKKLYKDLRAELGLSKEEFTCFLTDLEMLNRLSNKESIEYYKYSEKTKEIIASYVTVPVEKMLLKDYMDFPTISPKFIPVGSFLSRKEVLYPVCIKNEYLSTTTIKVDKETTDNNIISDTLEKEITENYKRISLIEEFLAKNNDYNISIAWGNLDYFLMQNYNLRTLLYGLEKRDPTSLRLFLDSYLTWLSKMEINVGTICELNYTIQSLQNKKNESMINYNYFHEMLEWFIKGAKEICTKQEKEEFINLIGNNQIIYNFSNNQITALFLYFHVYETKSSWKIAIPIEDSEIKPYIKVLYTDEKMIDEKFDDFRNDWNISKTNDSIIYSTLKKEDESMIGAFIPIKNYLDFKRKGKERKKVIN